MRDRELRTVGCEVMKEVIDDVFSGNLKAFFYLTLVRLLKLGKEHHCWGNVSVWFLSPQIRCIARHRRVSSITFLIILFVESLGKYFYFMV